MPAIRSALLLRLIAAVRRRPALRRANHLVRQAMIRLALYPIWLARRADQGRLEAGSGPSAAAGQDDVDDLNAAAERYFADFEDREYLLDKPFSDRRGFAQHLFDMGVLFHWLRLEPGCVVAEIGAGTCWLSQFLNRFGCRTIAIDVSPTALELGREVFRRDPRTNWDLAPRFLTYDGRRLPLADGSCDRVVINDAFHHVPNPEQLLAEMARVLAPHGIVAMCEPGAHHSETADSRREARTGVLERDIVVGELAAAARGAGFARVCLVPLNLGDSIEIAAADLEQFLRGRGFIRYWTELSNGLVATHYLLLYKSAEPPDTRRPDRLKARIEIAGPRRRRVPRGEPVKVEVAVGNRGNTRWLADRSAGWTRLGVHREGPAGDADPDWHRAELPADLGPEETVELALELPALDRPGVHELAFDMVIEGRTWFEEHGSEVARLRLLVEERGGRPLATDSGKRAP